MVADSTPGWALTHSRISFPSATFAPVKPKIVPFCESEAWNTTLPIGNVVFQASDSQNGSIFGFTGANVAEGNEMLELVRAQPGDECATMNMAEKGLDACDGL